MNLIMLDIEKITPYGKNPRSIPQSAIDAVAASLKEYGFQQPLVVYGKENELVIGHTRLLASKQLGLTEVPVYRADNLTRKQIKALRIVDNKTSEKSSWDLFHLQDELKELDIQSDVIAMTFSHMELDSILSEDFSDLVNKTDSEEEPKKKGRMPHDKKDKAILLDPQQYMTVMMAINKIKEHDDPELSDAECLTRISKEWMEMQ